MRGNSRHQACGPGPRLFFEELHLQLDVEAKNSARRKKLQAQRFFSRVWARDYSLQNNSRQCPIRTCRGVIQPRQSSNCRIISSLASFYEVGADIGNFLGLELRHPKFCFQNGSGPTEWRPCDRAWRLYICKCKYNRAREEPTCLGAIHLLFVQK